MSTTTMKTRVTSFAPQFLVDDLERSIAYYQKIGFSFDEPWDGFYAIGHLDGLEVHLKEAPKNQAERQWRRDNEHLDAATGVDGIEAFYEQCVANGVTIIKSLAATTPGSGRRKRAWPMCNLRKILENVFVERYEREAALHGQFNEQGVVNCDTRTQCAG